jgi:hypothetical protein
VAGSRKPTTSTLAILRNYESVLRAKGFEPINFGRGNKDSGLGFTEDETVGYWRREEAGKGTIWVSLYVWYNGGPDARWPELTIVGTNAMEQTLEADAVTESKAATLADALHKTGRVAAYGITFDVYKATLRPGSCTGAGLGNGNARGEHRAAACDRAGASHHRGLPRYQAVGGPCH